MEKAGVAQLTEHRTGPIIVIPHLHPGYVRRRGLSNEQNLIYWYSWVATWVYMDVATDLLSRSTQPIDRLRLCKEISRIAENKLNQSSFYDKLKSAKRGMANAWESFVPDNVDVSIPYSHFDNSHLQTKHDYNEGMIGTGEKRKKTLDNYLHQAGWSKRLKQESRRTIHVDPSAIREAPRVIQRNTGPLHEIDTPFDLNIYMPVLERCGQANGEPNSEARHVQAKDLFRSKVPSIYSSSFPNENAWTVFLSTQPKDVWIAACVEALQENAGMTVEKKMWLVAAMQKRRTSGPPSFEERRSIFHEVSCQLMQKQQEWLRYMETRGKALECHLIDHLQGSNVHVGLSGDLFIKFWDNHGKKQSLTMKLGPYITPVHFADKRTIHFTEDGIDIRNSKGRTLLPYRKESISTLPAAELNKFGSAKASWLKILWESITGKILPSNSNGSVASVSGNPIPASNRGHPIPKRSSNPSKPFDSPQEQDALWLLNAYLENYFPQGGRFWRGSKQLFPHGTDDEKRFAQ